MSKKEERGRIAAKRSTGCEVMPWCIDAANLENIKGIFSRESQGINKIVTPHGNQSMRDYLHAPIGSSLKVLVAPKGYGKTYLLSLIHI